MLESFYSPSKKSVRTNSGSFYQRRQNP